MISNHEICPRRGIAEIRENPVVLAGIAVMRYSFMPRVAAPF
jgi:hypothetical protein